MSRNQEFSSEGPSWADISVYIQGMHDVHQATVDVVISSDSSNYAGTCQVTVKAVVPVLVGPARVYKAENTSRFPTHQHKRMEALIYRLLFELDARLSQEIWTQSKFA